MTNQAEYRHLHPQFLPDYQTCSPLSIIRIDKAPAVLTAAVFVWYQRHNLPATPINPTSATITALNKEFATLPSLADLPNPKETSVSIITPPFATRKVLAEAKQLGIPAVWMQPGTFDDEVMAIAREDGAFEAVVGGEGGRGDEGWCVLVDGERGLKGVGKL